MSSMSYSPWQAPEARHSDDNSCNHNHNQNHENYRHDHHHQHPRSNPASRMPENSGPRAKCDQVIFEALTKATEIIVKGRSVSGAAAGHHHQQVFRGPLYGGGTVSAATNSSSSSSSNSSRFNLMVPEIGVVRQILQRWRRALHVPLRVDLYYQNPNGEERRQLLERWCLEYSQDSFAGRECCSSDPIVQLRQVCKKIVIWLRNLYCASRLLPAQAFQHPSCAALTQVGFSIYGGGDGDTADLVDKQGFLCQGQPSTVLTPYGELAWKVFFSAKAEIEPLLPSHHPFKAPLWMPREASTARPIRPASSSGSTNTTTAPVAIPRNNSATDVQQLSCTPYTFGNQLIGVPQSAPVGGHCFPHAPDHTIRILAGHHQDSQQPRNTYHAPRHMMHRSSSDKSASALLAPEDGGTNGHCLQRRNTSIGIQENADKVKLHLEEVGHQERLLSGLSLALMTEHGDNDHVSSNARDECTIQAETSQVEKRRVALHHAPPHLRDQKLQQKQYQHQHNQKLPYNKPDGYSPQLEADKHEIPRGNLPTTAGEYGYAYNNHIAWQQIRPSSTVPVALPGKTDADLAARSAGNDGKLPWNSYSPSRGGGAGRLSSSPSPLVGTPPSGAFLRTLTGGFQHNPSDNSFIPPRNAAMAPPFPTRPTGFATEPPSPSFGTADPQQQAVQKQQQHLHGQQLHQQKVAQWDEIGLSTTTSLDLLHSSPFQQGTSALSSLSAGATFGPTTNHSIPQNSLLRPSVWNSALAASSVLAPTPSRDDEEGLEYEMPFAVDQDSLLTTNAPPATDGKRRENGVSWIPGVATESMLSLGSSSAVASFAHKCAPTQQRLKLFETLYNSRGDMPSQDLFGSTSSPADLTNQLAEFRNFGASLSLAESRRNSSSNSSDEGAGGSVMPIPFRTS